MDEVTVLLADDHTIVRQGLKRLLEEAQIQVVGETAGGRETIKMAAELQPDVILMDIEMPEMDGISATREIKRENPSCKIVILTMHDEKEYIFNAIKAGAVGYVLKDRASDELVEAINAASKGLSLLQPGIARNILNEFEHLEAETNERFRFHTILTAREKEILNQLTRGMSNKEIAKVLFISDKTVRNHLRNIFEKLHINDRTTAAVMAVRQGLA